LEAAFLCARLENEHIGDWFYDIPKLNRGMSAVDYSFETEEQRPGGRWGPIYTGLRDAIVSHRLAPGAKLPEDELASIYSVSRTLVRSALQALSHDRLVNLRAQSRCFCRPTHKAGSARSV